MKRHARVVVIGGGIVGCALAYRLARMGWRDVMLVEKTELTAGTTWHSTGLTQLIADTVAVTRMNILSLRLLGSLEAETGQPVGLHRCGGIRLGKSRRKMAQYQLDKTRARRFGVDFEVIGPDDVQRLFPLIVTDGLEGASYTPEEGYVDASMATQAMAKGARDGGAEIVRGARVTALRQRPAGDWEVVTNAGTVQAEIVVNATGFWAPEIGAMVGISVPIVPMERQYIITDTVPEVQALSRELPALRDNDVPFYFRQEGSGLLFGVHEAGTPFCFENGIPPDFGMELLPPDLERGADHIEKGMKRVPAFSRVGIKRVVCGPTSRTVDFNVLMGPVTGIRNFYMLAGFASGVAQGAGAAQLLAEWIIEGEPSFDVSELDVNRFGPFATRRYVRSMLVERHSVGTLDIRAERQAGRPAKTSAVYHRLKDLGARFGARFGWECPLWFAPAAGDGGTGQEGDASLRRAVTAECCGVREGVGLIDLSSVAKYQVSGPGAETFLDRLFAGALPRHTGSATVGPMLNERGGIKCQLMIVRTAPHQFYLTAATAAELHHLAWLRRHQPTDGTVAIENLSGRCGTLLIAGPRSGNVLAKLTDADLSPQAFPWTTARNITVGLAPLTAVRFNIVGEQGWELHHPIEYQAPLFDALMAAGEEFGLVNFGLKALDALRLEKAWPLWGTELTAEVSPLEAGLEKMVAPTKGDFVGRRALIELGKKGIERGLACLVMEDGEFEAHDGSPVYAGDDMVGTITSASYGPAVRKSLALAYLPTPLMVAAGTLEIEANGQRRAATVRKGAVFDPEDTRTWGARKSAPTAVGPAVATDGGGC